MHRVEEYLRRAEEAEARAEQFGAQDMRDKFLEIARQWRTLARQALELTLEARNRRDADKGPE